MKYQHETLANRIPVSVVIPNYNSGSYLHECVASINTGKWPKEIIIVDDGSTDSSPDLARQLSREYDNVRLILRDKNGGSAQARLDGILAAECEWISYVDADDYLEAAAVEDAYNTALRAGADVCIWQMWRSADGQEKPYLTLNNIVFPMSGRDAVLATLGKWQVHPLGVSKKSVYLAAYDGFGEVSSNADELITRLAFANSRTISHSRKIYYYRDHPNSKSRSLHAQRLSELDSYLWLISFSREYGADSATIRKLVRDSIAHAWRLWSERSYLGLGATKEKLRFYLGKLAGSGELSVWIARHPRHAFALGALTIAAHTSLR